MADHLTVKQLTNTDPRFYPLLGPLLARRSVVRDLGGPIWDDDDKTWWVALAGDRVVGFCAARETPSGIQFQSAWVDPDSRQQGVYRVLFDARDAVYRGRPARARVSDNSLPMFLEHGFRQVGMRGRFVEVSRGA